MSERMPTISVHLHCTMCGGRGFNRALCVCVTDQLAENQTLRAERDEARALATSTGERHKREMDDRAAELEALVREAAPNIPADCGWHKRAESLLEGATKP